MNRQNLKNFADTINLRSERERFLMMGTVLVMLYIIFAYLIQPTLMTKQANINNDINLIQTLIDDRSRSLHKAVSAHNLGTNIGTQQKIEGLNRKINQFSDKLSGISSRFVDANEMTSLIKSILNEHKLELQQLENTAPQSITKDIDGLSNIYKHGLYLEITGSYHNHIRFLERLKQLPWTIFWEKFHLQVHKPGEATVSLSIYTLNYSATWLEI